MKLIFTEMVKKITMLLELILLLLHSKLVLKLKLLMLELVESYRTLETYLLLILKDNQLNYIT